MLTRNEIVRCPLNYAGNKFRIVPDIINHIPPDIETFVDIFGGSGVVSVNAPVNNVIYNDHYKPVYDLLCWIKKESLASIVRWFLQYRDQFGFVWGSDDEKNKAAFQKCRDAYNEQPHPVLLLLLTFSSFGCSMSFNKNGEFNNSFSREIAMSQYQNLVDFAIKLKQQEHIEFYNRDFYDMKDYIFNLSPSSTLIYFDPPTVSGWGNHNKKKQSWSFDSEIILSDLIKDFSNSGYNFILSSDTAASSFYIDDLINTLNLSSVVVGVDNANKKKKKKAEELLIMNF